MTTERPDARSAPSRAARSVPTPRSGIPTTGFGTPLGAQRRAVEVVPFAAEPQEHGRAVTIAVVLMVIIAAVALVVAFRIVVPTTPTAAGPDVVEQPRDEVREQPGSVVDFGQVFTYGNGLSIAVNPPQTYEPSANATGVDQGVPSRVQVVVTNRTTDAFRPNTLQVGATSGGEEAIAVWDPDQGIGLTGPDVSIPVGATLTFDLAFAAVDPVDLRLEITPALYGYGATVVERP